MSVMKPSKTYFKNSSLKIEKRETIKEEASDAAIDEFNDVLRHLNVLELVKFQNYKLIQQSITSSSSQYNRGTISPIKSNKYACALQIDRDGFKKENHFYAKVLNSKIHPVVGAFFKLGNEAIIRRYKQLHTDVDETVLKEYLNYKPLHFKWAG